MIRRFSTIGIGRWRRFAARFDWPLFVAVGLISALGLINLYSATLVTAADGHQYHSGKFDQQVLWMGVGLALYLGMTLIDYRNLTRVAWIVLAIGLVTGVIVFFLGRVTHGAQRWIDVGLFRVQPAEVLKLGVILCMAWMIHERELQPPPLKQSLLRWGALFLPVILVAAQPDLGSGTLIYLIILTTGYLTLSRLWPWVVLSVGSLLALPVLWEIMYGYQQDRVLSFLECDDPLDKCYHTKQSILAIGSGQILGKGFLEGTQSRFKWVAEQWTDFPFAVWAEEWGFIGSLAMLALFVFLLAWIINVALTARDRFGTAICVGVAAMTFWHVVVNIGMELGLAPVVGVTLPLVSYGGSSVLIFFLSFGLVSSVSLRRHGY
ncbi:MAG TPA: rod shape-determining protein RodA [Kofleriaceae bacterium]|nr:rod shape-determining protein RodA [Kofleriaceae bacterium]